MAIASKGEFVHSAVVKGVVLRMTMEEVQAICDILSHVSGSPTNSRRGHVEHVLVALLEVDGVANKGDYFSDIELHPGSIHFKGTNNETT